MSDLPLVIRRAIRDQWDSPTSTLRNRIASLKGALGYEIVPEFSSNWSKTYEALGTYYIPDGTDKAAFVTTIVEFTQTFYETVESLIASLDADGKWSELLLERLECGAEARKLTLDVADIAGPRPSLSWVPGDNGFWMSIPRSHPAMRTQVQAGFQEDLLALTFFTSDVPTPPPTGEEDEWAEISVTTGDGKGDSKDVPSNALDIKTKRPMATRNLPVSIRPYPTRIESKGLPDIKNLRRPTELFKVTVPYVMIVDATTSPLVVECSHQPSLELLAGYLKTWSKQNSNDSLRRSILKVDLHESCFFAGFIDALTVEPHYTIGQKQPINPTVVLAFIEGVLGFKETHTTGIRWVYKLDTVLEK